MRGWQWVTDPGIRVKKPLSRSEVLKKKHTLDPTFIKYYPLLEHFFPACYPFFERWFFFRAASGQRGKTRVRARREWFRSYF